jgi:Dual oxidase maturation factor
MNILLMVVPRYGAYTMVLTGVLVLSADLMYLWLLPDAPLQVRFEVGMLKFELGWCFWLTLVAGKRARSRTPTLYLVLNLNKSCSHSTRTAPSCKNSFAKSLVGKFVSLIKLMCWCHIDALNLDYNAANRFT